MKLQIKDVNMVKSKSGDEYWKIETSEGLMSCWDKDIKKLLTKQIDEDPIDVQVETSKCGKYRTIRGFGAGRDNLGQTAITVPTASTTPQELIQPPLNQDSLEIGSASKGGKVKVYFNADDVEGAKIKVLNAKAVKEYAVLELAIVKAE